MLDREEHTDLDRKKIGFRVLKGLGILLFIILLLLFIAFMVVHFWLSKIDYQNGDIAAVKEENMTEEYFSEDYRSEDEKAEASGAESDADSGENSSAEEIAALEKRMGSQISEMEDTLFSEDVFNILLIGCDSRQKNGNGRSDTNILVSINSNAKEITMTSIMRDSYVSIPGHGNNRINAAYAYGGAGLLLDTVTTNFGVRVDKYAAVDFYSFMDIIDVIGGVDIEVSNAEAEVMNRYIVGLNALKERPKETDQLKGGGLLHLNGTQALAYARVRYVGNADFERTQRQRTVLTRIFEKVKKMNLIELGELLNVLLPEIKTNMSEKEVLFFLIQSPEYLGYELKSLRIPADGSYESLRIRGMAVLGVDLEKNRRILAEEVYKVRAEGEN